MAWWPGDGNAQDIVGGNNGILVDGVTFADGERGAAFNFDGSSGYVSVPNSPLWNFGTNNFTIEFWANFNSTASGAQSFISCDNGPYSQNKWIFFYGYGVNGLTFHLNGAPGNQVIGNFPFSPIPGQWYHLGMTRNGSSWTFYTNGAVLGTDTETFTVPSMTAPLTIGNAEGGFYFNGLLDEISIYNRALASNEIAAIYNAGSGGKCENTPFIVTPPSSVTALAGASASFSVVASGAPPLAYQWYFDDNLISGATNAFYTIANVQVSNGGTYSVLVSNAYGWTSLTNAAATLTVEGTTSSANTVAYYRFEEGANGRVASGTNSMLDSSGNSLSGTPFGNVHYSRMYP